MKINSFFRIGLLILLSLFIFGENTSSNAESSTNEVTSATSLIIETIPDGGYIEVQRCKDKEIVSKGVAPLNTALESLSRWQSCFNKIDYNSEESKFQYKTQTLYNILASKPGYISETVSINAASRDAATTAATTAGTVASLAIPVAGLFAILIDQSIPSDVEKNKYTIKLFPETLEGKREREIEKNIGKAIIYKDDQDDAVIYYTNLAINDSKYHEQAFHLRANALLRKGDTKAAIDDLNILLDHNKDSVQYLKLRGVTYKRIGNYSKAHEDFSEALRLKPDYAEVYFERSKLYHKNSQFDLANSDLNKACDKGCIEACNYKF